MNHLTPETLALLRQSPLFSNLGPDEEMCLRDGEEVMFDAGSILMRVDDKVAHFAALVEGEIRISRRYGEHEVLLATISPGQFFREILLLLEIPSVVQAVPTRASRIVRFDRTAVFRMLRTFHP